MSSYSFEERHIGPREDDIKDMLDKMGLSSLDELIDKTIPSAIRLKEPIRLDKGISEHEYMNRISEIGSKNKRFRSYIGLGYYNTFLPPVIQRNILENPSWYTSYTPYQAEISQGRLEGLLNFQTAIMELTGMELANASLLDESTAAAEAMIMMFNLRSRNAVKSGAKLFVVDENVFPQTLDVLKTRAEALGIELMVADPDALELSDRIFGMVLQYPAADGAIYDYSGLVSKAHEHGILVAVAADILSLTLLTPPGEWDADVVVGSTQRFGIPLGYGGPHAGYFATREKFKRNLPGRIIGVSVDSAGKPALRMALQTREQHIKRERATSNICTAQALLANMAGMYAAYHGPEGLRKIAARIHSLSNILNAALGKMGLVQENRNYFDTLKINLGGKLSSGVLRKHAEAREINLRYIDDQSVGVSLDETTLLTDVEDLISLFAEATGKEEVKTDVDNNHLSIDPSLIRQSGYMRQDVFNCYHSETEMMRYIKRLERKDFSLTHSMISLGSCTMKLNAAIELFPLTWPGFSQLHPFVPIEQAEGYQILFKELADDLLKITGFDALSFQPNSGAAGEYTGLLVIREYHLKRGDSHRNIILIPASAHGTNPASAVMAGMEVIIVDCDNKGNVNTGCLQVMAEEYSDRLAGFMVTYPSTHGVFEKDIKEMTDIIHSNGGLVYMDGANMNAQVGYTNPANIGADVCHLNLHKTFAIPHGGGGPGMGPIAVTKDLAPYLPGHPVIATGGSEAISAVAAAPWGSPSILTISHAYIKLMGGDGLTKATAVALLNANYIAHALKDYYGILFTGEAGFVAHEMILECRNFKQGADVIEADIAKRLMDYGFHAPTLSFPVHGTLMVEPTESESREELDRFIEAMRSIHAEIKEIEEGAADRVDNVLKNAPHTQEEVTSDNWEHSYSRRKAGFPLSWVAENKFWPAVARVDDAYGDRNLMCSCLPLENYRSEPAGKVHKEE